MKRLQYLKSALVGGASVVALASPSAAKVFDIPDGDLATALNTYIRQSGVQLVYMDDDVRGHRSRGAKGDFTETAALMQLLRGTGFTAQTTPANTIGIVPQQKASVAVRVAQAARRAPMPAAPMAPTVETVVVTAQHKSENIQSVPIAITALSQQQLTDRQIAAGPDLVKEVPNLTFSKTNFSGYNLEIRGIGTQAISVTTDPAVAVAFNDIPFIRNHFFEQEFYDLQDIEVLRGPQGTLYGRNATAGVVNIKSALPTGDYEAMLSGDFGNYNNRRLEGMLNLPIVGDMLDLRIAGEWTKRDGYSFNTETDSPIDGRDLWSGRVTVGLKPSADLQMYLVWEHFSEDDDRLRSGKQLCETDYGPGGTPTNGEVIIGGSPKPLGPGYLNDPGDYFSQGCSPDVSLYSPQAFEAPLGYTLPYILGLQDEQLGNHINPYASETQSTNLRDIESGINPTYRAKNDTLEFNVNYQMSPALTFTSQTGYNEDFLFSAEDYNRFGAAPGLFVGGGSDGVQPDGVFCDPQLGCSDRLELEDLSEEHAWQLSQEFRVASNFSGPLNFTAGANYLHYETVEYYYVFGNVLTLINGGYVPGAQGGLNNLAAPGGTGKTRIGLYNPLNQPAEIAGGYVDPNPITSLNNEGHNYFLSQNPYVLNSYATFGEATYRFSNDLNFIAGLRWTDDQKHFLDIPSWLVDSGWGYPVARIVDQQWGEFTGRVVANWTPQLDFTDQTLIYGSYAHGYKAGGANPPGAIFSSNFSGDSDANIPNDNVQPTHPLTFKPEFVESFELGTKNTLLGNALTLNGDVFYYNYSNYQISEIVDRTAINLNFNAHAEGAELEADWEPLPGLKFGLAQGFEHTGLAGGDQAVDLMDRTAGNPNWVVVKPFVNEASNCIFPVYVAEWINNGAPVIGASVASYCAIAYDLHLDPLTGLPYVPNPTVQNLGSLPPGYPGFNPLAAPNDGAGFSKNLGGNELPNAPQFTTSLTAEYTMPVSDDWAATFHTDFYWQSQQWARVFEDPIDKIHGYGTTNVSLILTSDNGWQVMGYVKNVFDVTAITGTFLNSDDSGLTTNVFLTDPRLFGVRVTKHLDQNDGFWGSDYSGYDFFTNLFSDPDGGKPPLWIELGGQAEQLDDPNTVFAPPFVANLFKPDRSVVLGAQGSPSFSIGEEAKITFMPDGTDWVLTAAIRYGRSSGSRHEHAQTPYRFLDQYRGLEITVDAFPQPSPAIGDAQTDFKESHMVLDFQAGKDVGLGFFGAEGTSVVSVGVRSAQFADSSDTMLVGEPRDKVGGKFDAIRYFRNPLRAPFTIQEYMITQARYDANRYTKRDTHAVGPSISWNASSPVAGNDPGMTLTADWGANGAILFGRQRAKNSHETSGYKKVNFTQVVPPPTHYTSPSFVGGHHSSYAHGPRNNARSRMVAIPNLGGFAGVSMKFLNAKVSVGYRADFFFNAMDTGIDAHRNGNIGFFGPYANISIGFGG